MGLEVAAGAEVRDVGDFGEFTEPARQQVPTQTKDSGDDTGNAINPLLPTSTDVPPVPPPNEVPAATSSPVPEDNLNGEIPVLPQKTTIITTIFPTDRPDGAANPKIITTVVDISATQLPTTVGKPASVSSTPTDSASTETPDAAPDLPSAAVAKKGLGTGPIAGIAVGVAVLAILVGLGVFFFLRKKKKRGGHRGDTFEQGIPMVDGKQVDGDDGSGSGVLHSPGGQHPNQPVVTEIMHPQQQQHNYQLVDPGSSTHYQTPSPITGPPHTSTPDQDLIDRPVSPVLPDDAPGQGSDSVNPHGSSRDLVGVGGTGDGRGIDEDDPEMQWILEEERRARERREQQEGLRRMK